LIPAGRSLVGITPVASTTASLAAKIISQAAADMPTPMSETNAFAVHNCSKGDRSTKAAVADKVPSTRRNYAGSGRSHL